MLSNNELVIAVVGSRGQQQMAHWPCPELDRRPVRRFREAAMAVTIPATAVWRGGIEP